jgi:choline dehydrogenase-like flavoprotein
MSRGRFGLVFVEAPPPHQVALMQAFDDELTALRRTAGSRAAEHWFAMLKYLTAWGFCTSVLNAHNQAWEVPNLFVTDGACTTSSGCQNPSLTYMALTARAAHFAVEEMKRRAL